VVLQLFNPFCQKKMLLVLPIKDPHFKQPSG
jgi:hypothetical protein